MQTKIKSCLFSMDFLSNIFQNITPGKSKNIHLKEAGTLPNFISNDDKYKISSLTLSGEINGTDLRLLRDMAGYNYLGVHTNGTLHELDMTDVRIVKGGDSYVQMHVSSYYVEADDELPERIFRKCCPNEYSRKASRIYPIRNYRPQCPNRRLSQLYDRRSTYRSRRS